MNKKGEVPFRKERHFSSEVVERIERPGMDALNAKDIRHSYVFANRKVRSLDGVSLTVAQGEFVAVIGRNGCGKSTLAKHFNRLVALQEGELLVAGLDASRPELAWELRRHCGMVFQNPDNQFVSTIVEEDLAFGLDNFDVAQGERAERIARALEQVDMTGCERRSPHQLSGGQKQRVALAGVLAVQPDIVVLDEATTMLPPEGRSQVLAILERLRQQGQTTIFMITHYIEEAASADRVIVMRDGRVIADGPARAVLTDIDMLAEAGLEPPFPVRLNHDLAARGINLEQCPITIDEAVDQLCRLNW